MAGSQGQHLMHEAVTSNDILGLTEERLSPL